MTYDGLSGREITYASIDAQAIVCMDPFKKAGGGASSIKAQKLLRVLATLRKVTAGIPIEGHHSPGLQRILQTQLTLTPFGKECPKNECTERQ